MTSQQSGAYTATSTINVNYEERQELKVQAKSGLLKKNKVEGGRGGNRSPGLKNLLTAFIKFQPIEPVFFLAMGHLKIPVH